MNQAYESASFVRCVVPETADIQAASAAVAANPESGDAWMKKGHALAKVSMMREAEECYAMAISCAPSTGNITVIVRIASCPAGALRTPRRIL